MRVVVHYGGESWTGSPVQHVVGALGRKAAFLCRVTAACLTILSFATAADQVILTFNCLSLEWDYSQGGVGKSCPVQYRVLGADAWRIGHPLWWDRVEKQYRWGSARPFMDFDLVNGEVLQRTAAGDHLPFGPPHVPAGSFVSAARVRDVRLAEGSPGIDGGIPIANFNDSFAGKSLDCGAIEFGSANLKVGTSLWRPSDAKSNRGD